MSRLKNLQSPGPADTWALLAEDVRLWQIDVFSEWESRLKRDVEPLAAIRSVAFDLYARDRIAVEMNYANDYVSAMVAECARVADVRGIAKDEVFYQAAQTYAIEPYLVARSALLADHLRFNERFFSGDFEVLRSKWDARLKRTTLRAEPEIEAADALPAAHPSFAASPAHPQKRSARTPSNPQTVRRHALIREIIQSNATGKAYCALMDERGVRPPPIWLTKSWPGSYVKAYSAGTAEVRKKWRRSILLEKSRHKPKSPSLSSLSSLSGD